MFHAKVRIRHCGNFPITNQATSTELYITTRKNAFDTAEVLKTFENQHCIGFFVIGIIRTLYGLCQVGEYQNPYAGLLERRE